MNNNMDKLLSIIPKGKQYAIHLDQLALKMNMSRNAVKHLVREARIQGKPIISGKNGYWIAETNAELEAFAESLKRAAVTRLGSASAIKEQASMIDGQINLNLMDTGKTGDDH